jgi:DNA helicase-2/ATP-dependent DNA helicase PcrA
MEPENIVVATFTIKASNEMAERIERLLGDGRGKRLVLGTFHSIARRYLKKYGPKIGVSRYFGVADTGDSESILKKIIKEKGYKTFTVKEARKVQSRISRRKAKGDWTEAEKKKAGWDDPTRDIMKIYDEYEAVLKANDLLDFDDMLLRCVDLLRAFPRCVDNVTAVLIDEFQDTNLVQFDMMRLLAAACKRVTIVGDPDQSIYGWRSAEQKNYDSFHVQYPGAMTIALEHNYRSSAAILAASLRVIQEQTNRKEKDLVATHVQGRKPILRKLRDPETEAFWIALEIKRILALTGGMLDENNIAILLRSQYMSRPIEQNLMQAGISYRMAGGRAFWDRAEIKILVHYLRAICNPRNNVSLMQVINEPKRGVGEETVKKFIKESDEKGVPIWDLLTCPNSTTNPSAQARNGISRFMRIIKDGQTIAAGGANNEGGVISQVFQHVSDAIDFKTYWKKQTADKDEFETRWENVEELFALAREADAGAAAFADQPLAEIHGLDEEPNIPSPLLDFLSNITLATDKRAQDEAEPDKPRVTISTIHAAKGLEWPVVFVPAVNEGSLPSSRSEDADEERRLLYVAMTRAKALLYVSYCARKRNRDEYTKELVWADAEISHFLMPQITGKLWAPRGPEFTREIVHDIASILRVQPPNVLFTPAETELLSTLDDRLPEDPDEDQGNRRSRGGNVDLEVSHLQRLKDEQNRKAHGCGAGGSGYADMDISGIANRVASGFTSALNVKVGHTTTMSAMPGFSTARAVLAEQPVNAPGSSKRPISIDDDDSEAKAPKKGKGKIVPKQSSKRDLGQKSVAAMFGMRTPAPVPKAQPRTAHDASRLPPQRLSSTQVPAPSQISQPHYGSTVRPATTWSNISPTLPKGSGSLAPSRTSAFSRTPSLPGSSRVASAATPPSSHERGSGAKAEWAWMSSDPVEPVHPEADELDEHGLPPLETVISNVTTGGVVGRASGGGVAPGARTSGAGRTGVGAGTGMGMSRGYATVPARTMHNTTVSRVAASGQKAFKPLTMTKRP